MVANGASELFIEVFEERGAHACSALGVSRVPFGCCVEIEMLWRHLYRKVNVNVRRRNRVVMSLSASLFQVEILMGA
jgi:hypothetical protein